jgi:hypothetical protein
MGPGKPAAKGVLSPQQFRSAMTVDSTQFETWAFLINGNDPHFEFNSSKSQTRYSSLNPTNGSPRRRGQALRLVREPASAFGGQGHRPRPETDRRTLERPYD